MKNGMKYTIYTALIIAIIFLNIFIAVSLRKQFSINYFQITVVMLINVSIGLMLGLEYLVIEIKKEGPWRVNLPKLTIMGLPLLYLSLSYILFFSRSQLVQTIFISTLMIKFMTYGSEYVSLFQVILGYIIITSIYKSRV